MFDKDNKSVEQIAKERKINVGTIYEHLAHVISKGQSVDLNRLEIKQEEIEELEVIVRQEPLNSNVSKLKLFKIILKIILPILYFLS
jgi:predicted transcriptional regulator